VAQKNFLNRREGAENIKYKFRFAPKFAKHLHQPDMFNGSRALHILDSFNQRAAANISQNKPFLDTRASAKKFPEGGSNG